MPNDNLQYEPHEVSESSESIFKSRPPNPLRGGAAFLALALRTRIKYREEYADRYV